MDDWEKDYIQSNLVSLIEEIDPGAIILYLLQLSVISRLERDQLNIIGRQSGMMAEAEKLLDILRGRVNGYQHLTRALYMARQTGPLITLLFGIQINTLANPFQYCGIYLNTDELLPKIVNFGGDQIRLADLCKHFNEQPIDALRKCIDASIYKCLIGVNELTVAKDTTPTVIPYYIKRTITRHNKLDRKIFQNRQKDYFLIKNIEPYQLTRLAQMSQINVKTKSSTHFIRQEGITSLTSVSSEQIRKLTSRFILLEDEQHFDYIWQSSEGRNIHLINFNKDSYHLERSSKPETLKFYLLDDEFEVSEKDFLKSLGHSYPVIIIDTPGMGKSAILANLACQAKQQTPTEYIVYFEMDNLVKKLLVKNCDVDISLIETEIIQTISPNPFSDFINRELLTNHNKQIHLYLDAFDEVDSNHQNLAIKVIKILNKHKNKFKVIITTRQNQGCILENVCGVIGHCMKPFQLDEQIKFLVDYWQTQYEIRCSSEVTKFAENLLLVFSSKISKKDREVTGIPLQCKMLADVYAETVKMKLYSVNISKVPMNTIYDMYRGYFCQRFPDTLLQPGKCKLLDMHFKLALDLLCPEFSRNSIPLQNLKPNDKIFSKGIIELNKSGEEQFVHRTFAEFFAAEFVVRFLFSGQETPENSTNAILKLCLDKVLDVVEFYFPVTFFANNFNKKKSTFEFITFKFRFPAFAFFFSYSISYYAQGHKNPYLNNNLEDEIISLCPKMCQQILLASIEGNLFGLYKWITSLSGQFLTFEHVLKFVDRNFFRGFARKTSSLTFIEFTMILASKLATTDFLTMHCAFLESNVGKPYLGYLKYQMESHVEKLSTHPVLICAERGDYHCFELIFYSLKPDEMTCHQIIDYCLNSSNLSGSIVVAGKKQILKFLFSNPTVLNIKTDPISLFSFEMVHVDLLLFLFGQGIDPLETNVYGTTVAHQVASYSSADEYHMFVEWLAEHDFSLIFKMKNKFQLNAVYCALRELEIRIDTLQLLAVKCSVNFNEKTEDGETEMVSAIKGGRSVTLLQTLVQLGADIKAKNKRGCTLICQAIKAKNTEALKYFLSLGINPNIRCDGLTSNIWEHVLQNGNESSFLDISEMVVLLLENGADVNSATINFDRRTLNCFSLYKPASSLIKKCKLKPECTRILDEKSTIYGQASAFLINVCCWTIFCCCCCFKPCSYCQNNTE